MSKFEEAKGFLNRTLLMARELHTHGGERSVRGSAMNDGGRWLWEKLLEAAYALEDVTDREMAERQVAARHATRAIAEAHRELDRLRLLDTMRTRHG